MKISLSIKIFFSYSHSDENLRNKLANHLKIFEREGIIESWHDRRIVPGQEWSKEISQHLNSAHIILLLVSSDFLSSDYCWDIEVKRAMELHKNDEAIVIPIILRDCLWDSAPFGRLQALPIHGKPVTASKYWSNQDEAFTCVAKGIRDTVQQIQNEVHERKARIIREELRKKELKRQILLSAVGAFLFLSLGTFITVSALNRPPDPMKDLQKAAQNWDMYLAEKSLEKLSISENQCYRNVALSIQRLQLNRGNYSLNYLEAYQEYFRKRDGCKFPYFSGKDQVPFEEAFPNQR